MNSFTHAQAQGNKRTVWCRTCTVDFFVFRQKHVNFGKCQPSGGSNKAADFSYVEDGDSTPLMRVKQLTNVKMRDLQIKFDIGKLKMLDLLGVAV